MREMRELASELERKKKLRKKEERRETRERKKIGNPCIMREEKEVIVENKAFHKLSIVHGTAEFLHNLDISKIDNIGFHRIDYGENGINGEQSWLAS